MDGLSPYDLMQVLPGLLYGWSALILVWGVLAHFAFIEVSKRGAACHRAPSRSSDRPAIWLLMFVNAFLTWYLFTEESLSCSSWIAVVNVFYTAHLTYLSVDVARWWKSIKRRCTPSSTPQLS